MPILKDGLNPCSNGIWFLLVIKIPAMGEWVEGLNPCSNGIWFLLFKDFDPEDVFICLNPYSTGIWFLLLKECGWMVNWAGKS